MKVSSTTQTATYQATKFNAWNLHNITPSRAMWQIAPLRTNAPTRFKILTDTSSPTPQERPRFTSNHEHTAEGGGDRVSGLHKWEGEVVAVLDDYLTARLSPLLDRGPELEADFGIERFEEADWRGLEVGDFLYITVREVQMKGGYKSTTSAVRVRRAPKWTDTEVADILNAAQKRRAWIGDLAD